MPNIAKIQEDILALSNLKRLASIGQRAGGKIIGQSRLKMEVILLGFGLVDPMNMKG